MEADKFMLSVVPVQDRADIPLLVIYNQFIIGLQKFHAGRGIIISVHRIQLNAINDPEEDEPLEVDVDVPELSEFNGEARALLSKPNRETGRFEIATMITPEERETPYHFLDAWSTYVEGSDGPEVAWALRTMMSISTRFRTPILGGWSGDPSNLR
jgi:hypothetical protein